MKEYAEEIKVLKLFNEKVDKLLGLRFTKEIQEADFLLKIRVSNQSGFNIERFGPDSESIDAFALTIRFFVQDNEPISLRNMFKLYTLLPINEELKRSFNEARNLVNSFFDEPSDYVKGNHKYNKREIFEVFLYGGLAHSEISKKQLYDEWKNSKRLFPYIENQFVKIVSFIFVHLEYIKTINEKALKELEKVNDNGVPG